MFRVHVSLLEHVKNFETTSVEEQPKSSITIGSVVKNKHSGSIGIVEKHGDMEQLGQDEIDEIERKKKSDLLA